MEMPKAPDEAKERFRSLVPDGPDVSVKPMFGNLGAFVNGNMFAGVCGSEVMIRLPEAEREKLKQEPWTGVFAPMDRPMKEYVTLGPGWRARTDEASSWMERAFEHTASLPPKEKKPKKAK